LTEPQKEWVTLEEAAAQMGIKRATIYYYLKDLGIEAQRFGRDRKGYLSRADVEKLKDYKENPWKYAKPQKSEQGEEGDNKPERPAA
jgi:excisionase family DNA binding protein